MAKEKILSMHPVGFALGLTSGIVYALCAAFVVSAPQAALAFFNDWFHGIKLDAVFTGAASITWVTFIRGLVEVMVFAYVVGAIFAWTYNACYAHCKRLGWI
ncbi:MAG: DUF5676 family membrane protein [Nanoarchaeota archaeon]